MGGRTADERAVAQLPGMLSSWILDEALLAYTSAGMDRPTLIAQTGFRRPESLNGATIQAETFGRFWRRLARHLDDEFFGMSPRPLSAGSFAFMARHASGKQSLADALTFTLDYLRLAAGLETTLDSDGERASMTLHVPGRTLRPFTCFTFWLIVHGLACWLTGRRLPVLRLELQAAAPDQVDDYETRFGPVLHFNADADRLTLPIDAMNLPVRRTQPEVEQFLAAAPANLLEKYRDQHGIARRVTRLLRTQAPSVWPDLDTLAASQQMSSATLRRHLAAAGQPYQAIKDRLRRDMALTLLSQPATTNESIAIHLGFLDLSSFYKAFRKWTNQTPGQYRASIPHLKRLSHSRAGYAPSNGPRLASSTDHTGR
jgi:AraC-like DNA-binding protein